MTAAADVCGGGRTAEGALAQAEDRSVPWCLSSMSGSDTPLARNELSRECGRGPPGFPSTTVERRLDTVEPQEGSGNTACVSPGWVWLGVGTRRKEPARAGAQKHVIICVQNPRTCRGETPMRIPLGACLSRCPLCASSALLAAQALPRGAGQRPCINLGWNPLFLPLNVPVASTHQGPKCHIAGGGRSTGCRPFVIITTIPHRTSGQRAPGGDCSGAWWPADSCHRPLPWHKAFNWLLAPLTLEVSHPELPKPLTPNIPSTRTPQNSKIPNPRPVL